MIILDSNNKSLQIVLGSAVTTNQLHFSASFADTISASAASGASGGLTNNTTPVTLVAAPACSTQRKVKSFSVQNADTACAKLSIIYNDNGNLRNIFVITLNAGDNLVYEDSKGFAVFTNAGSLKRANGTSTGLVSVANNCNIPTQNNIGSSWVHKLADEYQ